MRPLVSVMIPCYNSNKSLPFTLSSMIAQSYTTWECIIIDDGSTDEPIKVIEAANDHRMRFHRFERNQGRAIARQKALDMAQGEYICMVDADDWIYPWKLERQVEAMEANPELALVSSGMAIIDTSGNLIGTRLPGANAASLQIHSPLTSPRFPPFAHGPSIIRAHIAKQFEYDVRFRLAQDVDFLLKIILKYPFGVIPELFYVYTELGNVSLSKILEGNKHSRQMFQKYRKDSPLSAFKQIALIYVKNLIYSAFFNLGYGDKLIRRRSVPPTPKQMENYLKARQIVTNTGIEAFRNTLFQDKFTLTP